MRHLVTALLPMLAVVPGAHALTLDFGESGSPVICSNFADGSGPAIACGNFSLLSQAYGDVAGVADITYSAPRQSSQFTLNWWSSNYNNLYGVVWAPSGDLNSQARIEIKAVQPGDIVTLSSFDLGAYSFATLNTTVSITTIGGGTTLFSYSGPVGENSGATATAFPVNVSAAGGLWITWQDSAYNVGIDHIEYNVSSVPEPAALALMLAGLGVVGWRARRR